ncbi:MAG: altronate dehydratase [Verrucomicrobiae bacterium]|nr:altronate dehydratase [Verrucomicrobiae bacterium]
MGATVSSEYAIVVDPADNIAVAKKAIERGTVVTMNGSSITVNGNVLAGHRFAVRNIPAGEWARQYNQPFGKSKGIRTGDPITNSNLDSTVPKVDPATLQLKTPKFDYVPENQIPTFTGFRRPDGRVGVRNWVLIVPTSMCSSHESNMISMMAEMNGTFTREKYPNVDGVTAIPHTRGCGCPDGASVDITFKILADYLDHPNVGAVLIIELGCEKTNAGLLDSWIAQHKKRVDKPVKVVGVQQCGGTQKTIEHGLSLMPELLAAANQSKREPVPVSELILGLKCGGSDGFSGIGANPALGYASDLLLRNRGTSMITEVTEFVGAEHLFAERCRTRDGALQVFKAMDRFAKYSARGDSHAMGENPSPGNKEGGLINITIKSLGALAKSGTAPVEGVVEYGEPVPGKGLWLLYCPSYDQESMPALIASGAQIGCFTTGRGTGIGNAIAPVIKIASNTPMATRMAGDIDVNCGTVIDGTETIEQSGRRIFEEIIAVANGKPCKAELNKHREFMIWNEEGVSL